MEHLYHRGVAEKIIERIKFDAIGQRIHQHRLAVICPRHCQLHKAEFGIIGAFAQKFRIYSNIGMIGGLGAKGGQVGGGGDRFHEFTS